ncbi:thymidine phosphorylase-like [Amphiura filiformis]|uniref:thymidine phosphorylase-like n=1 Tax=Amphiura filiformis TaxID=82378 RepID=UPI003B2137E0
MSSSSFRMPDIIRKKRDGYELSSDEIKWFIDRAVGKNGERCDDSQLGALLMAIVCKGMSPSETVSMTSAMTKSGDILDWPDSWRGKLVDKHSTGGVGDKISLVLAPALAACGMKVPMISGRGLAHTGGTLDKMESIPGYNIYLDHEQMTKALETVGCCIVGQTQNLVPADRKLYKTRDITATIESFPLIVGSIISKKAAENIDALILDVKCGKAAFMKTTEEGRDLAKALVNASAGQGIKTMALLTNMDCPIGNTIGNALEVAETLQCLHGHGPADLVDIVCNLGGYLLELTETMRLETGREVIRTAINDGTALNTFRRMLIEQGVEEAVATSLCDIDMEDIDDVWACLVKAANETDVKIEKNGYVAAIDGYQLAIISHSLGAGRANESDKIDHAVGIRLFVKHGSKVNKGDVWLRVYHSGEQYLPTSTIEAIKNSLTIRDTEVQPMATRVIEPVFADN